MPRVSRAPDRSESPEGGIDKRAAGYVRVSQVGGREGDSFLSPDVQREKIEAWASYRGYQVVRWYIDMDASARKGKVRPEFERMMQDAADGRFEAVAVYRLTRFGRSVSDAARRYEELEKHGVDLVSVTEDIDTTTAGGKFMRNVLFAIAEFESERIGEEWRNVHAARRRRGIAHVVSEPLGYHVKGAEITGVDESEAVIVRLIYQLRAKGLGYGEIRNELEARGHTSKKGRPRVSQSTLAKTLRNPIYAGLVRSGGELVEAVHEPIVPRELWERVQATHSRFSRLALHRAALLSGLVVCAGCEYRMSHEAARADRAASYRCSARLRSTPCTSPVTVQAGYADAFVEAEFLRRFDPRRMPHRGKVRASRQQAEWERTAARLRARADELTAALDGLADQRYVKGSLTTEEYERQTSRYLEERADALDRAEDLERLVLTVRPLDRDVLAAWPNLSLERRQRALRMMISQIDVLPSPRKGPGQRALMGQRLRIGWLR